MWNVWAQFYNIKRINKRTFGNAFNFVNSIEQISDVFQCLRYCLNYLLKMKTFKYWYLFCCWSNFCKNQPYNGLAKNLPSCVNFTIKAIYYFLSISLFTWIKRFLVTSLKIFSSIKCALAFPIYCPSCNTSYPVQLLYFLYRQV